jgi:hypothetical protein
MEGYLHDCGRDWNANLPLAEWRAAYSCVRDFGIHSAFVLLRRDEYTRGSDFGMRIIGANMCK